MSRKWSSRWRIIQKQTNMPMEEWVSPSEFARRLHKSTTYVYSLIREKKVEYKSFKRGKYVGYLIHSNNGK